MANNKISRSLVALSSAAIIAVYWAGYERTSEAAKRFSDQDERKPLAPVRASFVAPAQALPALVLGEAPPIEAPETKAIPRAVDANTRLSSVTIATPVSRTPEVSGEGVASANPSSPGPALVTTAAAPPTNPAPAPAAAPEPAPAPAAAQSSLYKDGSYSAWGSCRHGDIEATVVIESGRIAFTSISQCYTRYPCSWISNAPGQVVSRQSLDVDYVSGATQSINAFRDAVYYALQKAQ